MSEGGGDPFPPPLSPLQTTAKALQLLVVAVVLEESLTDTDSHHATVMAAQPGRPPFKGTSGVRTYRLESRAWSGGQQHVRLFGGPPLCLQHRPSRRDLCACRRASTWLRRSGHESWQHTPVWEAVGSGQLDAASGKQGPPSDLQEWQSLADCARWVVCASGPVLLRHHLLTSVSLPDDRDNLSIFDLSRNDPQLRAKTSASPNPFLPSQSTTVGSGPSNPTHPDTPMRVGAHSARNSVTCVEVSPLHDHLFMGLRDGTVDAFE